MIKQRQPCDKSSQDMLMFGKWKMKGRETSRITPTCLAQTTGNSFH